MMNTEISDFHQQIAKSSQRSTFVDPKKLVDRFGTSTVTEVHAGLSLDPPIDTQPLEVAPERSDHVSDPVSQDTVAVGEPLKLKNFRLADVPERERPRERMHELGPAGITNTELLAILLGSGIPGMNVKNVADNLLTEFDGLRGLSRVSPFNLRNIEGIGKVKSDVLTAAFELGRRAAEETIESPDDIYGSNMPNGETIAWAVAKQFTTRLRDSAQEEMWVVMLDVRNRYRGKARVYIGCCDQLVAKTGEILSRVVERNFPRYALVHNHPSGRGEPSGADISFTERLVRAGYFLDIELVDHIVLGEDQRSYVSMKQRKLVEFTPNFRDNRKVEEDVLSLMSNPRA